MVSSQAETEKPQSSMNELQVNHVTGLKLGLVVTSVTLVVFLMLLDMSIIVTAIPHITAQFHSLGDVGWYGSAYLLSSCALQPLAGKLYTLSALKYTFLVFLGVFEIGSAICGAAHSSTMLIVGRAVAGIGGSGLTNGAITILSAAAPKQQQPLLIGIMMGLSQIAIVCGPLLGGAFTQHASWRWCFYINLPVGALAAILLLAIHIPKRVPTSDCTSPPRAAGVRAIMSQLDLLGFVLFASFAVMISLALEWGGSDYKWNSSVIIGLFCGAGISLLVFGFWERYVGNSVAMIPFSVTSRRQVWCSCLFLGFFSGALLIFSYYLPIYFQAVKDVSPTMSGVYMLPGIGGQIVMAIVSGAIIGKTGYYVPWALASGIIVPISAGLISTFQPHTSIAAWVMYQFLGGFGRGCGMQTPIIAIQHALPPQTSALGISLAMFGQTFGGSLFLTLAKLIFSAGLNAGLREYAPSVSVEAVTAAGATGFRDVVPANLLSQVLLAYGKGIGHTFYLAAGASAATFFFAWGMGRVRLIGGLFGGGRWGRKEEQGLVAMEASS